MNLVLAARPPGADRCARWSRAPTTSSPSGPPDAAVDHYQAKARVRPGETPSTVFVRLRDRLLAYDIFPPGIVQATICPAGTIAAGATIIQRIVLGPLALEAAVRVIEVWDRPVASGAGATGGGSVAGFRYVTLRGHPECGVASFEVRVEPSGAVMVLLDARSRPGTWLTRLGRPFARRFQRALTRAALRRLTDGDERQAR
jgi:uncharacterized protein (UPF0548 family)